MDSKRPRLDESCLDTRSDSHHVRSLVAEIYASYTRLMSTGSNDVSNHEPDAEYQRLLDLISLNKSPSITRLAMRILPRLLKRSPSHSQAVAGLLMTTLSNSISATDEIAVSSRTDAMQGMERLLNISSKHLSPSSSASLAHHISQFVISLLHSHHSTHHEPPSIRNPSKRSHAATLIPPPTPSPSPDSLLATCFTLFPRVVLSLCLASFLDPPSSVMGQGSLIAFNKILLAPPHESFNLQLPVIDLSSSQSLASVILERLPDTRAWLRQRIVDICRQPGIQMGSSSIHQALEKLVSLVLPPPPLLPPPPPLPSSATTSSGHLPPSPPPFIGRGGPVCVASPTLFLSSLSPSADEAQIRRECHAASANVSFIHLFSPNDPHSMGLSPYGLKSGEAYASFTSITDAALFYDACALSMTIGEGKGLSIEFCPVPLHHHDDDQGKFIWILNRPPLTSPSSLLSLINELHLPSPHQVIQVSGQAPGHLIQYIGKAGQSAQGIAHALTFHLYPPSLIATLKQRQQFVVVSHFKWEQAQKKKEAIKAALPSHTPASDPIPPPYADPQHTSMDESQPISQPHGDSMNQSPPLAYEPKPEQPEQARPQWTGQLCKSGIFVCNLFCTRDAFSPSTAALNPTNLQIQSGGFAFEPHAWSTSLDVKQRGPPAYAVDLYIQTPSTLRALRWLEAVDDAENESGPKRLRDFAQQLMDKERAGVIKWEGDSTHPPRTLFLIPPSMELCLSLGAEWPPHNPNSLLAVIVPQVNAVAAQR